MENYGFRCVAKYLFTSYIENRLQCVIYYDINSDFCNINVFLVFCFGSFTF